MPTTTTAPAAAKTGHSSGKHTEQYGGKGLRSLSSVCINKIRSSLSRNILNCRIAAFTEMEEGSNASHFNTALLKHSIPLPDGPAESLEKHMTNPETFCGVP